MQLLRASLLDVLRQDYIRVLRAKGIAERGILLKHALRNALPPFLTAFGLSFSQLLGGTVTVETIFAWPGIGSYAVEAIFTQNSPAIQGYALLMTLIVVLTNLAVDLACRLADPRIRLGGAGGDR